MLQSNLNEEGFRHLCLSVGSRELRDKGRMSCCGRYASGSTYGLPDRPHKPRNGCTEYVGPSIHSHIRLLSYEEARAEEFTGCNSAKAIFSKVLATNSLIDFARILFNFIFFASSRTAPSSLNSSASSSRISIWPLNPNPTMGSRTINCPIVSRMGPVTLDADHSLGAPVTLTEFK